MNNIKDINQIPAKVYDEFTNGEPKFAAKVIVKNHMGQLENKRILVDDMDTMNMHLAHENVIRCKVYEVGEQVENEAIVKKVAKEFKTMKDKEARLKQYLELKKEFETLPIAEETLN